LYARGFARITQTLRLDDLQGLIDNCDGRQVAGVVDFTGCETIEIGLDDLWQLAQHESAAEGRWGTRVAERVALIAPQTILYGFLRTFQEFRKSLRGRATTPELRAFRSLDRALTWLEESQSTETDFG
jgi:hypothetical protein